MAGIKAGDSGTVFELPVTDNGVVVPLAGATVEVVFKNGERRFVKTATITDAEAGLCEVKLTAEDVAVAGSYVLQAKVLWQNGDVFSGDVEKFSVGGTI